MNRYPRLFEPWKAGSLLLRNRIIAAPITRYGLLPSPADELETIAAKARGGAAMVVVGSVGVNDSESLIYFEASSLQGRRQPLYNEIVSVIHQYGAKAEVQLLHCGMWADIRGTGAQPVGSTPITMNPGKFRGLEGIENNQIMDGRTIRALDEAGMDAICDDYARQAVVAQRMGFDMVMLHFAHGWLPAQFLSPYFNQRDDAFGGSFENRARFPKMIVERVRDAVGPDYPLDMRIGATEYVDGGLEVDDVVRFVQLVEDKLDLVHVSSGLDKLLGPTTYVESPSIYPHLINIEFARAMKAAVKIPVVTVGGITLPEEAEAILERGDADAIALGRALIADADWPNKARSGRPQERITPCLRCDSCYPVATEGISQGCAVNPRWGRALRLNTQTTPPATSKHVVVVGGGPAGIQAALTGASRGHQITLIEKENRLGGLLNVAEGDPLKQDMLNYRNHLLAEIGQAPVTVLLDTEATPDLVASLQPDELIVAVGSTPAKPRIPGIDQPHALDVLQAHEHLDELGQRVVVIGAGPSGCEMVLTLLETGRQVTLVEQTDLVGGDGNLLYRGAVDVLFSRATALDVLTNTTCTAITDRSVEIASADGTQRLIPADHVIYSVGMRPRRDLAESFAPLLYDVAIIGDCLAPRRINEAHHEGYFAGLRA